MASGLTGSFQLRLIRSSRHPAPICATFDRLGHHGPRIFCRGVQGHQFKYPRLDRAKIGNRLRWPARIVASNKFRFYFALNASSGVGDLTATVTRERPNVSVGPATLLRPGIGYADVDFPGERMSPHLVWQA